MAADFVRFEDPAISSPTSTFSTLATAFIVLRVGRVRPFSSAEIVSSVSLARAGAVCHSGRSRQKKTKKGEHYALRQLSVDRIPSPTHRYAAA